MMKQETQRFQQYFKMDMINLLIYLIDNMNKGAQSKKSFLNSWQAKDYFTFLGFTSYPELTSLTYDKTHHDGLIHSEERSVNKIENNKDVLVSKQEQSQTSYKQSQNESFNQEEKIIITRESAQLETVSLNKTKHESVESEEKSRKVEDIEAQPIKEIRVGEPQKVEKNEPQKFIMETSKLELSQVSRETNQQLQKSQKEQTQSKPSETIIESNPIGASNQISATIKQERSQTISVELPVQVIQTEQQTKNHKVSEQIIEIMNDRINQQKENEYQKRKQLQLLIKKEQVIIQQIDIAQNTLTKEELTQLDRQPEKRPSSIQIKNRGWSFYDLTYIGGSYILKVCLLSYGLFQRSIQSNQFLQQLKKKMSNYRAQYLQPISKLYSNIPSTLTTAKYQMISGFTTSQRTMVLSLSSVGLGILTYKYSANNILKKILFSVRNTVFSFAIGGLFLVPEMYYPFVQKKDKFT